MTAPLPLPLPALPSPEVLDRFAVPDDVERLPGGQGGTVRAGDLALSPDRDPALQSWLSPIQARLAYELDLAPGRRPLRLAMPVPARDGEWVVQGWAATRFEPDAEPCHDLDVALAAGRLLHAHLASAVPVRPDGAPLPALTLSPASPVSPTPPASSANRWDRAEAVAFAPAAALPDLLPATLADLAPLMTDVSLGPDQLVHRDLASNVLLDARGSALVIDLAPTWRPALWADAICVLDSVTWLGAPVAALRAWRSGRPRQAMLRALVFRVLSDEPARRVPYAAAIHAVGPR